MMDFKGVAYDVDGVLLDTECYQWKGWVEPLKKFGVELSEEEYIIKYAGKTGAIIEEALIKEHRLAVEKGSLLRAKEALLMKWFAKEKLDLMPYAVEGIEHFNSIIPESVVCSGGPKNEIILKLKRTGLLGYFGEERIASSNEVKRGKPYPDIYLYAAKLMGVKPAKCIAFEDTQYGVQSAKDAGLFCIAMPNKWSRLQDFSRADLVAKNFREAIKLLDNLL
jgi:HAD superfamily hydrolase (TIGR01509 family)